MSESPFACVMGAIAPENREHHISTAKYLFHRVVETVELPNGYGFRFAQEVNLLAQLAEFVSQEKLCCPFFGFALEVEPEGGPVWLKLTGRDGVKPFIRAELAEFMGQSVMF
jgi:hypothetical protein